VRTRAAVYVFLSALLIWALTGCGGDAGEPGGGGPRDGSPPTPSPEIKGLAAILPAPAADSEWVVQQDEGWSAVGRALYDRIDGAAEAHMQYDFTAAVRAQYVKKDAPDTYAEVTIYRFGSSAEAFGAYSVISERRGDVFADLGDSAVGDEGALFMWQDVYLVHIVGSDTSKAMYLERKRMAWTVEKNIAKKAPGLPAIFDLLPSENRLGDTERYAHTAMSVTKVQPGFVARPLGLSRETEVAVAEYAPVWNTPADERNRVFLIRYPTAEAAARAFKAYAADQAAREGRIGRQTVMQREGAYIVGSWRKSIEAQHPVIPAILQRIGTEEGTDSQM